MGVFDKVAEALRQLVLLQDEIRRQSNNFEKLSQKVAALDAQMAELAKQLIRLETREAVVISRAESAAREASVLSRQNEIGEIRERLRTIELYLRDPMQKSPKSVQDLPAPYSADVPEK